MAAKKCQTPSNWVRFHSCDGFGRPASIQNRLKQWAPENQRFVGKHNSIYIGYGMVANV